MPSHSVTRRLATLASDSTAKFQLSLNKCSLPWRIVRFESPNISEFSLIVYSWPEQCRKPLISIKLPDTKALILDDKIMSDDKRHKRDRPIFNPSGTDIQLIIPTGCFHHRLLGLFICGRTAATIRRYFLLVGCSQGILNFVPADFVEMVLDVEVVLWV